jgi:hypothetical protein
MMMNSAAGQQGGARVYGRVDGNERTESTAPTVKAVSIAGKPAIAIIKATDVMIGVD